ncbi:Uncharacterized protein FKW44_006500, partial [Caligus rogercresseyi]
AGSFILPFAIENLIGKYGFRGATLILGSCMLHICISAALYRPIAYHAAIMRLHRKRDKSQNTDLEALSNTEPDKAKNTKTGVPLSEVDNISICSSASSHFHHHHSYDHLYHHNNNISSSNLHALRGSIGSLARSLPPGLEHNCGSHLRQSSNVNSHEELYWPEAKSSEKPHNHTFTVWNTLDPEATVFSTTGEPALTMQVIRPWKRSSGGQARTHELLVLQQSILQEGKHYI